MDASYSSELNSIAAGPLSGSHVVDKDFSTNRCPVQGLRALRALQRCIGWYNPVPTSGETPIALAQGFCLKRLFVVLLLAAIPSNVIGQDGDSPAEEPIDEITVYGEKSLILLETELKLAQQSMFEVFNSVNTTESFKVKCDYRTRLETRRRYLDCVPNFMNGLRARLGSGVTVVRNGRDDPVAMPPHVKKMNDLFWAEMARLVTENPELRSEFLRLEAINAALEAERQKRRGR